MSVRDGQERDNMTMKELREKRERDRGEKSNCN